MLINKLIIDTLKCFNFFQILRGEKNAGNSGYGAGDEKDPNQNQAEDNRGSERKLPQVSLYKVFFGIC